MGGCNRAVKLRVVIYSCFCVALRLTSGSRERRGRRPSLFPSLRAARRRTPTPALSFKGIRSDMRVRIRPPPESPQPRLRTSSYVIYFFWVRDPFCCSCTDGRCSFIHEGDSQVFLAPHRQHVSDLRVGRVGGMERAEMEAEWEAVLPAGEALGSLRLFSLLLRPSGSRGLSIMHECHIQ